MNKTDVFSSTLLCLLLASATPYPALAKDESQKSKSDQDPTKIITKFGVSYGSEVFQFSGSFAFDPVRKIYFQVNDEFDVGRIGGSWLFDIGIVNFNIGTNVLDSGAEQTTYSIGTFVPLSSFGFKPLDIQFFVMGGYSYNDGEIPCENVAEGESCNQTPEVDNELIMVATENHSGYLGSFMLKQFTEKWTALGAIGGSVGSDDYSGYWFGAGAAYQVTGRQSLRLMGHYMDNSYGSEQEASLGYSYQLN